MENHDHDGPFEIAFVGDLTDHEAELTQHLLSIPPGGECSLFFDSPGGSPYCAMSLMSLILIRDIKAVGSARPLLCGHWLRVVDESSHHLACFFSIL